MKLLFILTKYLGYSLLLVSIPWLISKWYYKPFIIPFQSLKSAPTAIVFGAGLNSKDTPSPVLGKRIQEAVKLYRLGKVNTILLSGDGLEQFHNEPAVMQKEVEKQGIPLSAIILDYAGNDTYNTCLNAKNLFDINKAILVTQSFHMTRALFICKHLGIESQGIEMTAHTNLLQIYRHFREMIATFAAFIEILSNQLKPD